MYNKNGKIGLFKADNGGLFHLFRITFLFLLATIGFIRPVSAQTAEAAKTITLNVQNRPIKEVLTLIDFTKPSNEERLLVLDMVEGKLLFHSLVAHGRNSGDLYATRFSNRPESHQSSLGLYLTEGTYIGKNGYSLRLNGLEKGINDNALARAIVIHGAAYADPSVCRGGRRLGRSWGCPALPPALNRPIIDTIKGGSVLYIYGENSDQRS